MSEVIIWTDAEGCHVTHPMPGIITAREMMEDPARYGVPDNGSQQIADSDTLPPFRDFRAAWKQNGSAVAEDMTMAKEVFRDRLRRARTPILTKLDGDLAAAIDNGNTALESQIRARKQRLRDAPADQRIESASDVNQLRNLDLLS